MVDTTATVAIYRRLLGAKLRADLQYRTSFLLLLGGQVLVTVADLAGIAVIFGHVGALAGWTLLEVALLYALSSLAFGVADMFVSQAEAASRHIKAGTFDQFLVRPVGTLLQLSAMEFALRRVGRCLQPAVVLVISLAALDIDWTPGRVLLVPVTLASGVAIYGAIWVLTSSMAFWTVETQEIANAFTYGGNTLSSYPLDLFAGAVRRLVVFVVPLAFVAYLPAAEVLGKPLPLGLPPGIGWAAPAVAAGLVAAAGAVWRLAVRHYRSTGS